MVTPAPGAGQAAHADPARLRRTLGDPALARLVARLARRLELGRRLDAPLVLDAATEAERLALDRLLGRPPTRHGHSLRIWPEQLSAALRSAGIAPDLHCAVEALTGPVVSRPEAAAAEQAAREAMRSVIAGGRHADTTWHERWAAALDADGTLTRLARAGGGRLAAQAVAVLDLLPADALPLPVLAEQATGDTKALSGTPLARLVLRALALRDGVANSALARRETQRTLWEAAGVIPDDLASQALVLGLAAAPASPLGRWLTEATEAGIPFRVTLHQLAAMPVTPQADAVFVCENPSVLRAAAAAGVLPRRGARSAALVCTEGIPSAACHRLLGACARAGAAIGWRGDFDWTGLRTVDAGMTRYGARPWRMDRPDYEDALATGDTELLRGPSAPSPWDPAVAARMAETGRAVMEERLIPLLLADLSEADER
jgi:uncharacterized protein (TIGR02679 family)